MMRLVEAQLVEDGVYPNAAAVFAEAEPAADGATGIGPTLDFDPAQPRDPQGRWTTGREGSLGPAAARAGARQMQPAPKDPGGLLGLLNKLNPIGTAQAQDLPPEEEEGRSPVESEEREPGEPAELQPGEVMRLHRFGEAWRSLKAIDPTNRNLEILEPPTYVPTETDIERIEGAARDAAVKRTCDFLRPSGKPIGERGTSSRIRIMSGGLPAAQQDYDYLSLGGVPVPFSEGSMVRLPYGAGTITLRPLTSTTGSPAIDVNIPGIIYRKLHY